LTLQRRHVGRPLRRRFVGLPHRMHGFAGIVFPAMVAFHTTGPTNLVYAFQNP
jgi:hypothetical protein